MLLIELMATPEYGLDYVVEYGLPVGLMVQLWIIIILLNIQEFDSIM